MTVSDQLLKVLLSSLAIILLCLPVAAQPAVSTPTASSVASPASSLGVGKPAGGKAAHAEVVIPPEKAQPVRIPRFEKPPVIDGKLDDEVWKTAAVFKDFYQTNPGDNIAPSKPTEAFIGYDSKFLYFAFHAYDDPSKVRATIAKRDQVFGEDNVRVYLDTFNDQRRAYILGWNPLGIQQDGIFTEGQGADFSVDIVMESKGIITDDGWTVEVAIPFKSLRYEAGKGKLWGIHLDRNIDRFNDELDSWMPISRDISGLLSQEGHITGLEGISTERTLELIPSLTLSETGKRKGTLTAAQVNSGLLDPGRLVNDPLKFDPGLTGKYTITPTVTLDFAINPDFAQVEADQLVVTANQRFPIFFEEKRPFFLEGIDIFRTPIAAVHTRAIIDPDVAVKLTGKLSRNTFGLLLASDKGPGNFSAEDRLTANPRFIDKNAAVGVLRLKHDVGTKDSFVGLLGTHYRFVDRSNELGGFDGRFRIDKVTTFTWQVLGTHTRRLFFFPEPGQSLDRKENALIYTTDLNNNGRHFGYEWTTVGRTRYYRADVGFNRRTNTNNQNLFIRYNSEPKPKARLISWRIFTIPQINFDWQGRSQNLNDNTQLSFNFQHSTFLGVGLVGGYERIFEEEFGRKRTVARPCIVSDPCTFAGNDDERSAYDKGFYVYGGSTPSKKYNFFAELDRVLGAFDYDFGAGRKYPRVSPGAIFARQAQAAGLCDPTKIQPLPAICVAPQDPGPGDFLNLQASFVYKPTDKLSASLDFTKQRLVRHDSKQVAFDEKIISLRTTYQFTRFIFARGRIDFDSLASNVKGQFLLGYTPTPGTAFYLGYNDDLARNGFSPFTGQLEPGFRRNGRTFFIKMSYLFRRSFGG